MAELRVENLSYSTSSRDLISGISFSLLANQRTALIGRNGAGKTTLLRCLLGQLSYEGEIFLNNSLLNKQSALQRANVIAYVPQKLELYFNYCVEEFITLNQYALRRLNTGQASVEQLRELAIEATKCGDYLGRGINSLSMGERQRVLLCAALAKGPKILLMDEPTAFLDLSGIEQFFGILADLPRETSFILATHELNSASRICTNALAIKGGELIADISTTDLMTEKMLSSIFSIKSKLVIDPESGHQFLLPPKFERE